MRSQLVSNDSEFESKIGYSRTVADGDFVSVSGTTRYDYTAVTITESVTEQVDKCLKILNRF